MKRVLCVRLPNWPIQRLSRKLLPHPPAALAIHTSATMDGESLRSAGDTVACDSRALRTLFPAARSGPAIVSVSAAAWHHGVRPGLPLAEARSMATPLHREQQPDVAFFPWDPLAERGDLVHLAESLRRFAPVVGLDAMALPDCLLLDVTGCGVLFGSESRLAEELLHEVRTHGYDARICISDTIAAAWAFTHADGTTGVFAAQEQSSAHELQRLPILVVPPGQEAEQAGELSPATLRLPHADTALLSQLGIRTVHQLLRLPHEDLPSRLSDEALLRIRQFRSQEAEQITPLPEADPVTAEWTSEFPLADHDGLRQVIEHLTAGIETQLIRRRSGCTRLQCELLLQDAASAVVNAHLLRPEQSAAQLCEALSLKLDALNTATAAQGVRLTATLAPLPPARQKDLFSAAEHIQPQEELAGLINRISNRLGSASVLIAGTTSDARPEAEIQHRPLLGEDIGDGLRAADRTLRALVQPEDSETHVPRVPPRPLHLLPDPVSLACSTDITALHSQTFAWNGRQHRIAAWHGPERLQTAWWSDEPVHRDYYVVLTVSGSRFWLFRELRTGTWYLHGLFE